MPTARELLEQADALMRRKHEPGTPAVDVADASSGPSTEVPITESGGPPTEEPARPLAPAPRHVGIYDAPPARLAPPPREVGIYDASPQRDPAAPASATAALSALRWTTAAPPASTATSSPVFAAPPIRSPRTIQREPIAPSEARTGLPVEPAEPVAPQRAADIEPDFPLLTDAVPPEALSSLQAGDEVPVLTDAVDPLADEPILEDDLGGPEVWSPTFGAAPTIAADAPAAAPGVPSQPTAGGDPLGLDRPAPGFEAPAIAQWDGGTLVEAEPAAQSALEAAFEEAVSDATVVATVPEAAAVDAMPDAKVVDVAPEATFVEDVPDPAIVEAEVQPEDDDRTTGAASVESITEAAPALGVVGPAGSSIAEPLDDARVREIAEEIGMQVLQRIDIFTDTELRARLGERLQPVVSRVSAELVAAINQHVGELLRAYVAEAIASEIDRWRDTHA